MKKGSIQPGIVRGKVEVCPVCGSSFKRVGGKEAQDNSLPLFCPNHPGVAPTRYRVMFGSICHHHRSYESARMEYAGLLYKHNAGELDPRDYQIKAKPLSFSNLADEWLKIKAAKLRPGSLRSLNMGMSRAITFWGEANIKSISYAHVEDFMMGLELSSKSKANILAALKQFWSWVEARYDIPTLKKWPNIGPVEMELRKTISIAEQEMVLAKIKEQTARSRPRSWLAIKWLATYIRVRPTEMLSITEGDIDWVRGLLIIRPQKAKEGKPKVVHLLDEDLALLRTFKPTHPSLPFFRHSESAGRLADRGFGRDLLWRDWKRACFSLGIEGVDLYGGTKHSTATGLREVATYEEVRKMSGHSTNKAFDRYLQLEGEAMRGLYARRQSIVNQPDNGLTMDLERYNPNKTKYIQ